MLSPGASESYRGEWEAQPVINPAAAIKEYQPIVFITQIYHALCPFPPGTASGIHLITNYRTKAHVHNVSATTATPAAALIGPFCNRAGLIRLKTPPKIAPATNPPTCATRSVPGENPIRTRTKTADAPARHKTSAVCCRRRHQPTDCVASKPNAPMTMPDAPSP